MLCSVLDDAINKSYVLTNEPSFYKACLIIIYKFWNYGL